MKKSLYILGTRGVPAAHGGFETFAERFALHMVNAGWRVTVYCQSNDGPRGPVEDEWRGIRRVTFAAGPGALGTIGFDLRAVMHAIRERGVMLALGYNTAVFSALLRLCGHPLLTNMDGIEWQRPKWPLHGRVWLFINEWVGAVTSNRLIADHPAIGRHLARMRSAKHIAVLPYGSDRVGAAEDGAVRQLGVEPGRYFLSIGRCEPENNLLPMIRAYVAQPRTYKFVCLTKLEPETNKYHAEVLEAGAGRVTFPGAIYDPQVVQALRFHAAAYCHGHSVGGTNPSLVEALGAGNAVVAHDNPYNRWVAGENQFFFSSEEDCDQLFWMIEHNSGRVSKAREAALARHSDAFTWTPILEGYRALCDEHAPQV